jgi:hypothetical protein
MPTLTNPGVIAVTLPRNYKKIIFEKALSDEDAEKMKLARARAERAEKRKAKAAEAEAVKKLWQQSATRSSRMTRRLIG